MKFVVTKLESGAPDCTIADDGETGYIASYYSGTTTNDTGCLNLTVSAGEGAACTITNTVFFESIPTLSQLGKVLMVLLVLGTGLVAYRRIVQVSGVRAPGL